ncbi:hypothetical protein CSHISOI_11065 [Colletotrichum shisoi]|uniref:Uncharacterized protein n=1 Tax=Colletotrichum shisoi TaxID=2078593 RepID=A0A5Q4BCB0_9PEZI|nr:hypothetical protein CSHISOI_11065 [Colletotrichum shisoi]
MGPASVVLSMSNNLTGRQTPSTPEDMTRSGLQLQLAQSPAAAGTGLSATTYRHGRDKRKAPHQDPTWNIQKPTGAEPAGPESSQAVKRRGQQDPAFGFGFASELQQYLDVLRQHEVEAINVPSPAPSSTPQELGEAVTVTSAAPNLPYPVIVPQRRSATTRARRGFVCDYYSPALRSAGVGEESFSGFIGQLNRVAELKPRAHAVSFGGFADACAGTRRDPFMSTAVRKAVEVTSGVGKPAAMNKFVTNMNDELFKPKGLVCLLVTWEVQGPATSSTDVSSWRMAFEQQEATEDSTGSLWGFDTFMSLEGAQQVAETQQKPPTEADDPEPRSDVVASPSSTTGAFEVVETDSLCLLITNLP